MMLFHSGDRKTYVELFLLVSLWGKSRARWGKWSRNFWGVLWRTNNATTLILILLAAIFNNLRYQTIKPSQPSEIWDEIINVFRWINLLPNSLDSKQNATACNTRPIDFFGEKNMVQSMGPCGWGWPLSLNFIIQLRKGWKLSEADPGVDFALIASICNCVQNWYISRKEFWRFDIFWMLFRGKK